VDLSKSDKKAARIIIDRGLEKEFENALAGAEAIVQDWRKGDLANKDAYHKLYKHVDKADGQIARRYDRLTGSHYFFLVAALYQDRLVTDSDLELLSEQVRTAIHGLLEL
jgi:hypothetical protein